MFGVEHEEYLEAVDLTSYVGNIPTWLASYSLCDLPLLFVYFQVNNGVLYFLDYVEDIYIIMGPLYSRFNGATSSSEPICNSIFLKKNQSTPRPSEHPPVMGEKYQNV